uniref:Peptidase S74 domain-containing protein n=1 Tax=Caenorhabditis tropicalis TaxID=1561998 RepID=A0A1I7UR94_9PELO
MTAPSGHATRGDTRYAWKLEALEYLSSMIKKDTTVRDYSSSAASSDGSGAKAVWNSDTVASFSSKIKDLSGSAATSVKNAAKATWNSDAVAATSSAVSSGLSSASNGVKSWWSSAPADIKKVYIEPEKSDNGSWWSSKPEKTKNVFSESKNSRGWWSSEPKEPEKSGFWSWFSSSDENSGDSIRGGIVGMTQNATKYVVSTHGKPGNILNIFEKSSRSGYGDARWWVRFDRPHSSVSHNHINISRNVFGMKDAYVPISTSAAKTVGALGRVAEKTNDVAYFLTTAAMIYESYRLGMGVKKDYDHGTTRNTIQTVATTAATYASGGIGASAGGYYGGYYSHVASEMALDHSMWDMAILKCSGCREEYTWKKYQEIEGVIRDTSATWNSELVSSTSSAVSNGLTSATNGISNWWSSKKGDSVRGGVTGLAQNARNYVVSTAGRNSNIVNVFDKASRSSRGNPRSWIRVDNPHGNVDFHHINVNKAITGVKDPHIRITPTTAKAAGALGKVAEKANAVATCLSIMAMINDAYQVGVEAKKDYDHGTSRNTIQTLGTKAAVYAGASILYYLGAAVGTAIFPGIGTYYGGIAGSVVGGVQGGALGHEVTKQALDKMQWDTVVATCRECKQEFQWKKYQDNDGGCCKFRSGTIRRLFLY